MKKSKYQISKSILFQYLDSKNRQPISASKAKDLVEMTIYEDDNHRLWTYLKTIRPSTSPIREMVSVKTVGVAHHLIMNVIIAKTQKKRADVKLYFDWKEETTVTEYMSIMGQAYEVGTVSNQKSGVIYYFRNQVNQSKS